MIRGRIAINGNKEKWIGGICLLIKGNSQWLEQIKVFEIRRKIIIPWYV